MKQQGQNYRQRGAVLFIALIVLIAMSLAAVALVRSIYTASQISGNMTFKQAATQFSDLGVESAVQAIEATIQTASATQIKNSKGAVSYSPVMYSDKQLRGQADGGEPGVDWQNLECYGFSADFKKIETITCGQSNTGYQVRYFIDRLCADVGGTNCASPATNKVLYRVTVWVEGPRNTSSTIQALLGFKK